MWQIGYCFYYVLFHYYARFKCQVTAVSIEIRFKHGALQNLVSKFVLLSGRTQFIYSKCIWIMHWNLINAFLFLAFDNSYFIRLTYICVRTICGDYCILRCNKFPQASNLVKCSEFKFWREKRDLRNMFSVHLEIFRRGDFFIINYQFFII